MKPFRFLLASSKVVLVLVVAFVLWQAWVFLRPAPRPYSAAEQAAIRNLCGQACNRIERVLAARGETDGQEQGGTHSDAPLVFGVAHFLNDPSDGFTAIMRDVIAGRDAWRVEEMSVIQKFLSDVTAAVMNATSLDEIVHAGRRVGLDVVVAGKVVGTGETGGEGFAEAMFVVYDVRGGQVLFREVLSATWRPSAAARVSRGLRQVHPLLRLLAWLALVFMLPLLTPFATHWAVGRKSNFASFALLAAYTIADLFLALLFSGFRLEGPPRAVLLCLAVAACGLYNYRVCERIAGKED